jgi:hypothetical protein
MGWYVLRFLFQPIRLFNAFMLNRSWCFIYWDKKCRVLELELFGKHIFYLYV